MEYPSGSWYEGGVINGEYQESPNHNWIGWVVAFIASGIVGYFLF